MPGEYIVHSESVRSQYVVDVIRHSCSCMDHAKRPDLVCKHRLIAGWVLYGDDWSAEAGQVESMHMLQAQLDELLRMEIRLIDSWEAAGARMRPDGTYPSDADLAPLKQEILDLGEQIDELRDQVDDAAIREGWRQPALSVGVTV